MTQPTWNFLRFVNRVLRYMRKPVIDDVKSNTLSRTAQDVIEVTREEYQYICNRRDWDWLRASSVITTEAEASVTGDVTNGSSAVTSVVGLPSYAIFNSGDSNEGHVTVQMASIAELYTIQPGATTTTFTLDRSFNGTTGTSASMTVFKYQYDLPADFNRFLSVHKFFGDTNVRLVGIQEFRDFQMRTITGASVAGSASPEVATIAGGTLLFWPWPREVRSHPFDYIRIPDELADNSSPILIPTYDIDVLIHRVMMIMYSYLEDDTRASTAASLFQEKYNSMAGQSSSISDVVQLVATNIDRARFRRGRRGRVRSSDRGRKFDTEP